jgi:glycerate dehydrogenase
MVLITKEIHMKIVILDRSAIGYDTPLCALEKFGEVVCYDSSDPTEAKERSSDAEIIILNKVKITRDILENSPALKLVCIFATGYDNIDLAAARELGIAVCNVPGYSTDSVALFTLSTVLALTSHLFEYNNFVKSGEYTASGAPNRLVPVYHELRGKTWGIIGYGNIGRAVARVAEAFGARVIVNKRTPCEDAVCVDIDRLCRESDIITIHCPLNDQTRSLINERRIAMMKPEVILVNEARGAVVDESAIARAILDKKIAAFGCDVYSAEPFDTEHPYNAIMQLPNLLLTPHAAWGSYEARERCLAEMIDNIKAFSRGDKRNRVDLDA